VPKSEGGRWNAVRLRLLVLLSVLRVAGWAEQLRNYFLGLMWFILLELQEVGEAGGLDKLVLRRF
jgi:hypothetical protein